MNCILIVFKPDKNLCSFPYLALIRICHTTKFQNCMERNLDQLKLYEQHRLFTPGFISDYNLIHLVMLYNNHFVKRHFPKLTITGKKRLYCLEIYKGKRSSINVNFKTIHKRALARGAERCSVGKCACDLSSIPGTHKVEGEN